MKKELKQAIVNFIFDNDKEFQLFSATAEKFRPYIYTNDGQYLIGGEEVNDFISAAIKLLNR